MQLDLLTSLPEVFLASPGVSPGSAAAREMTAISGRKCAELLPLSNLDGCLARMCRALMTRNSWASTECFLTWKDSATQQYRLKFRLVPSMPRTEGQESGLSGFWPSPNLSPESKQLGSNARPGNRSLGEAAKMWPTATEHGNHNKAGALATSGDGLSTAVKALWPTATSNDDNKTPEAHLAMKKRMGERDGTGANRTAITSLQVMAKALWSTPQSRDGDERGAQAKRYHNSERSNDLPDEIAAFGQTAKPSTGGALNPEFVCWLMGYPTGYLNFEPSGTVSSPKSSSKSATPSSKRKK
mgnify:CR=1 FL=1